MANRGAQKRAISALLPVPVSKNDLELQEPSVYPVFTAQSGHGSEPLNIQPRQNIGGVLIA